MMKAYNELMRYREDYTGHYWNQMVEVNNPVKEQKVAYWEDRILHELKLGMELAIAKDLIDYKALIERVSASLLVSKKEYGYITKEQVLLAEEELEPIGKALKAYKVHCVAHAHIDMNWMWGWHETVSITIDTFKTMLQLLKEYKDFTYSQSQASTYRLIEEYCPEMIAEIKKYVHEGRWELAASTWVENDRNMSNGESFARHILYTKNYLAQLFEIDVDMLQLDFEPDCFGHSAHIPEILRNGGVKYYYHCRGLENQTLYKWQAPSGASVIAYREPIWYGNAITGNSFIQIPKFCEAIGVKDGLFVYGVGDHGGGPTRRDIEQLLEMHTWPIYPKLMFSTYHNFFKAVETVADTLPVVDHELNFTLTGCFTSSSRIKMANRYSENTLVDTEYINAVSHMLYDRPYHQEALRSNWEKALFNQFHDILPGCGINFTREYALGEFQKIMAKANTVRKLELEYLVSQIDTQGITSTPSYLTETAEGAGVGNLTRGMIGDGGVSFNLGLAQTARYSGDTRLYTLFNHTAYSGERSVELMLWDYKEDVKHLKIYNSDNEELKFEQQGQGYNQYWGHWYTKLLVEAKLPSYGYDTIRVTQSDELIVKSPYAQDERVNKYLDYTLENTVLKAVFDPETLALVSLYNKVKGIEYLAEGVGADFTYVKEEGKQSNAWIVGRYVAINQVAREVHDVTMSKGQVAQSISYNLKVASSTLQVTVSLDGEDQGLKYHVQALWNEIGNSEYTPQLNYKMNLKAHTGEFIYDVPMGRVKRQALVDDVPAINYGMAYCEEEEGVYIASDCKYGYRGLQNSLALTLLRSSANPDTHPENGTHVFDFKVAFGGVEDAQRAGILLNHPVDVISCKPGNKGTLPQRQSFVDVKGNGVVVSSIKRAEYEEQAWIVRLYEAEGKEKTTAITFPTLISEAYEVDFLERKIAALPVGEQHVEANLKAYAVKTIMVVNQSYNEKIND
ncbi:MAG: glycoside hydrolase family 38 C-terminal domain-containing protein [Cellulosilyticaceae bacterium]